MDAIKNNNQNEYFQIIGKADDNRVIAQVKSVENGQYNKFTVPEENVDKYEKSVTELNEKYGKYVNNNYKKGLQLIYGINTASAALGGAITAALIKSKSKSGKFFKVLGGAAAGVLTASCVIGAFLVTKLLNIYKSVKGLGIEPYKEPISDNTNREQSSDVKNQ